MNKPHSYLFIFASFIHQVFQIIPHLQKSSSYQPELHDALVSWFADYWKWLSTSSLARQESKGVNNHGECDPKPTSI
jgi:hypothetical protein